MRGLSGSDGQPIWYGIYQGDPVLIATPGPSPHVIADPDQDGPVFDDVATSKTYEINLDDLDHDDEP